MKETMSKLIFLDVDGTIAMPDALPGRRTVEAIRAARANGHKVFLSTGRLEAYVDEAVREIGFDGGIYSAGGRVVAGGNVISDRPMPPDLVRRITDALTEENMPYLVENAQGVCTADGRVLRSIGGLKRAYFDGLIPRKEGARSYDENSVYKILFHAAGTAQAESLKENLAAAAKVVLFPNLAPELPVIPGEVSRWDIHKGTALRSVCQYLKADLSDCIAFGDSMNDAEIIRAAGIGIAMGNAEACVKEIADQICESCEEDGIAKALARMNLIQVATS